MPAMENGGDVSIPTLEDLESNSKLEVMAAAVRERFDLQVRVNLAKPPQHRQNYLVASQVYTTAKILNPRIHFALL